MYKKTCWQVALLAASFVLLAPSADANGYREKAKTAVVANSLMTITPPRDWNSLSIKPGKKAEVWTLDGE